VNGLSNTAGAGRSQRIDVLVVDPVLADAKITASAVRRALPGASTVCVRHARQAMRLIFERGLFTLEPEVPRLIFLEPRGADLYARSLLQRLRVRHVTRGVPVIVLSSCSRPGEIAQSYLMGARDHVVKPAHPSRYIDEVKRITALWVLAADQSDAEHLSADKLA
jgi:CheY-like chemotaxis protein